MRKTIQRCIRRFDRYKTAEKPARLFASRLLLKTGLCRFFKINKPEFKLIYFPSNMSWSCWYQHDVLKHDEDFFKMYLKKGDVVIDVGANIGILTLLASCLVSRTGLVFSVEPHPRIYGYLKRNLGLNKVSNVVAMNLALGEKPGVCQISDDTQFDDTNRIVNEDGIGVPVETLDNVFARKLAGVDLLKIDAEGYEKFVIEGGRELLKKTKCVHLESSEANYARYGYRAAEVIEEAQRCGFDTFRMIQGKTERVSSSRVSTDCENLIGVRDPEDFSRRTGLRVGRTAA